MPLRYKIVNFFVKRKKAIVGGLSKAVAEGLLLWRNVGVQVGENGCAGWGNRCAKADSVRVPIR